MSLPEWEYQAVVMGFKDYNNADTRAEILTRSFGSKGWELVAVIHAPDSYIYYLKRLVVS